jgi:hypothetical protein
MAPTTTQHDNGLVDFYKRLMLRSRGSNWFRHVPWALRSCVRSGWVRGRGSEDCDSTFADILWPHSFEEDRSNRDADLTLFGEEELDQVRRECGNETDVGTHHRVNYFC